MALDIGPLLYTDIPAFGILDEAANANWLYARAQEVPGTPRRVFVEKWTKASWGKDPNEYWMKVTDTETGELCSVALWKIPMQGKRHDEEAEAHVPAASEDAEGKGDVNFFADAAERWKKFESKWIGDQQYACLQILMTHPKHQRRGAGTMLVRWGCEKADEMGLMCALGASEVGEKVYTKNGFEKVYEEVIDLRKYGVDGTELARKMIRPAKKREE